MSFDDFLQEASFTNLNWNGSSGKLRVRAGGEQNELKLPQTFVVDPKTSQYGWRAWVPQPEGNKKPFDASHATPVVLSRVYGLSAPQEPPSQPPTFEASAVRQDHSPSRSSTF